MKVIVRHVKHKSLGTVAAAAAHTMRRRPTPNADPTRPPPEVWVGSSSPAEDVRARLPEKRRKNAVLALEYVLTASPEFFAVADPADWRNYLRGQLGMLQAYFDERNVVSAVLHLDEKTPHLSVMIVPLLDGKLNARAFVGTREACSVLQDLAGEVGRDHGLARGLKGSKARHQDVQRFYAEIQPTANRVAQAADRLAVERQQLLQERAYLTQKAVRLKDVADTLDEIERQRLAASIKKFKAEVAAIDGIRAVAECPAPSPSPTFSLSRRSLGLKPG